MSNEPERLKEHAERFRTSPGVYDQMIAALYEVAASIHAAARPTPMWSVTLPRDFSPDDSEKFIKLMQEARARA